MTPPRAAPDAPARLVLDTPARPVLDTKILLSALVFPSGSLAWLRHAWQSGSIRPLASRDTTTELIRVLCYPKFRLTDDEREDLLGDFLPWCETVTFPTEVEVPPCRDPFDRPFLALALTAKGDALVAGDNDLLALTDTVPVPILTPAAFRERMSEGEADNSTKGD